jgi:hypothetical protein
MNSHSCLKTSDYLGMFASFQPFIFLAFHILSSASHFFVFIVSCFTFLLQFELEGRRRLHRRAVELVTFRDEELVAPHHVWTRVRNAGSNRDILFSEFFRTNFSYSSQGSINLASRVWNAGSN